MAPFFRTRCRNVQCEYSRTLISPFNLNTKQHQYPVDETLCFPSPLHIFIFYSLLLSLIQTPPQLQQGAWSSPADPGLAIKCPFVNSKLIRFVSGDGCLEEFEVNAHENLLHASSSTKNSRNVLRLIRIVLECSTRLSTSKKTSKNILARFTVHIYTVSQKNIPDVFRYNSRKHCRIFIIFGRNITKKASSQKMLYFPTSPY